MSASDILGLLIIAGAAGLFIAAAWFAVQLAIVFIEYVAKCVKRRF